MNQKNAGSRSDIPKMIVQTSELAAIVGKSDRWIRQLTTDGILKQVKRGKYILSDAVQAYIAHIEGGKADDNRPRLRDEQAELTRIKKEIADLELSRLRGELHHAKDVETLVSDLILTTKAKLQAIPTKLAPRLDGEPSTVIEREIRKEINSVLQALADHDFSEVGKV